MNTLYAIAKNGKVKQWNVSVTGNVITVEHGYVDGKKQTQLTTCFGKNKGRANETSDEEQALSEAQSKWAKQFDKCYRESPDEARCVGELLPMLANDYTKVGHRIKFPCHVSVKLDGVRAIADIKKEFKTSLTSRGGKEYPVAKHIDNQLAMLSSQTGIERFDGELYIHGMALQSIISCVKKENENTKDLCYYIFDLPVKDLSWQDRNDKLMEVLQHVKDNKKWYPNIHIVRNFYAENEDVARQYMDDFIQKGYEGMMLRNLDGKYEFNHRSADLQKWKDFKDCEAFVRNVVPDKLSEGVLEVQLSNGIPFKCKMRGAHEERLFEVQQEHIGKWVTVKYQALTEDGVPQFPVAIAVRECNEEGEPLE